MRRDLPDVIGSGRRRRLRPTFLTIQRHLRYLPSEGTSSGLWKSSVNAERTDRDEVLDGARGKISHLETGTGENWKFGDGLEKSQGKLQIGLR